MQQCLSKIAIMCKGLLCISSLCFQNSNWTLLKFTVCYFLAYINRQYTNHSIISTLSTITKQIVWLLNASLGWGRKCTSMKSGDRFWFCLKHSKWKSIIKGTYLSFQLIGRTYFSEIGPELIFNMTISGLSVQHYQFNHFEIRFIPNSYTEKGSWPRNNRPIWKKPVYILLLSFGGNMLWWNDTFLFLPCPRF